MILPGNEPLEGVQVLNVRPADRVIAELDLADMAPVVVRELKHNDRILGLALESVETGAVLWAVERDAHGELLSPGARASSTRLAASSTGNVRIRVTAAPTQLVLARVEAVPGFGWTTWTSEALDVAPVTGSDVMLDNGLVRGRAWRHGCDRRDGRAHRPPPGRTPSSRRRASVDRRRGERAVRAVLDRAFTAIAAVQLGVCEEALRRAAEYSSARSQFGKPLSTFQGVALRAADAYIDTEALRSTVWQAAWRIDQGLDATSEALVAKWWACEAGHRVVHAAQHLHGGIGADVDYPQHRWFLWGTQLQDTLGGSGRANARLGQVLAAAVETEVA